MVLRSFAVIALALAISSRVFGATSTVDDIDIYWISEGEGPVIVFVHGVMCDTTVWADQISALSENYRVVALDLPGHGLSGSPGNGQFTLSLYASAVEAVRSDIGADEIVLVGHSLGAMVTSQYALNHPERAAGLVAVDAAFLPPHFPSNTPTPRPTGASQVSREQRVLNNFVPETPAEVRDRVLHMTRTPSPERAMATGAAMMTFSRVEGSTIDAPALHVKSGAHRRYPPEEIGRFQEVLPEFELVTIERTGHFLMMEKPEVFNYVLVNFLDEIGF